MVLEFVPCLRNDRTDRNSTSVVFSALVPRPTDQALRCLSGAGHHRPDSSYRGIRLAKYAHSLCFGVIIDRD